MAFHIIPDVKVGESSWGKIYGFQLGINFSESPNSLTVNYLNENGQYESPDLGLSKPYKLTLPGIYGAGMWYPISYSTEETARGSTLEVKFIDKSWVLDKNYVGLHNRHGNRTGINKLKDLILVGNEIWPCDADKDGIMDISDFPDVAVNCRPGQIRAAYVRCDSLKDWNIFDVNYCFTDLLTGIASRNIKYSLNDIKTGNFRYRKSYTGPLRQVLGQWGKELAFTFVWQDDKIEFIDLSSGFAIPSINKSGKSYISRFSESVSLEGTVKKDYISYYARDGDGNPGTNTQIGFMNLYPAWVEDLIGKIYYGTEVYDWETAAAIRHIEGSSDELVTAYWWYNYYQITDANQARAYKTDPKLFGTASTAGAGETILARLGGLRIYQVISSEDTTEDFMPEMSEEYLRTVLGDNYYKHIGTIDGKNSQAFNYNNFQDSLPSNMGFQSFEEFRRGGGFFCIVYHDDLVIQQERDTISALADYVGKYFYLKTALAPGSHDFNAADPINYHPGGDGIRNLSVFNTIPPVPGTLLGNIAYSGIHTNTGEHQSVVLLERSNTQWIPNPYSPGNIEAFINYYKFRNYKICNPGENGQRAIDSIKAIARQANSQNKNFNPENIKLIACWPGYFSTLDRYRINPLEPPGYFSSTEGGSMGLMGRYCRVIFATSLTGLNSGEETKEGVVPIWTPAQALDDFGNIPGYAPGYRIRYTYEAVNFPIGKIQDIFISSGDNTITETNEQGETTTTNLDDKTLNYDINYYDISDYDYRAWWNTITGSDALTGTYYGQTVDTTDLFDRITVDSDGRGKEFRDVQKRYELRNQMTSGNLPLYLNRSKTGTKDDKGTRVEILVLSNDKHSYCSNNTGILASVHLDYNANIPGSITGETRELFITTVGEPLLLIGTEIQGPDPNNPNNVYDNQTQEISFRKGLVGLSISYGEDGLHYNYTFRNKPPVLPSQEFIYKQVELSKPKIGISYV